MALPWTSLAKQKTTDGELELRRRGGDYMLTIGGRVLMTSVGHRSEDELAKLACERLRKRKNVHVMIGGLGLGFTLRAALDALGAEARVTVVEKNPVVAAWCAEHLGPLNREALADRRVELVIGDVAVAVSKLAHEGGRQTLDALVIDLYEGPNVRFSPRHKLYGMLAARYAFGALKPGGIYAIWGEHQSPDCERFLADAGFTVTPHTSGHGHRVHTITVGERPLRDAELEQPRAKARGKRSAEGPEDQSPRKAGPPGKRPTGKGPAARKGPAPRKGPPRKGAAARKGLARKGLAGKGLAGKGLARKGLARKGLAGKGLAGKGLAGKGPAGKGPGSVGKDLAEKSAAEEVKKAARPARKPPEKRGPERGHEPPRRKRQGSS